MDSQSDLKEFISNLVERIMELEEGYDPQSYDLIMSEAERYIGNLMYESWDKGVIYGRKTNETLDQGH